MERPKKPTWEKKEGKEVIKKYAFRNPHVGGGGGNISSHKSGGGWRHDSLQGRSNFLQSAADTQKKTHYEFRASDRKSQICGQSQTKGGYNSKKSEANVGHNTLEKWVTYKHQQ